MSEVTKIVPQLAPDLPAHLAGQPITGMEEMAMIIRPPRLKIIQKQAGSELQAAFNIGDIILSPMNAMLAPFNKGGTPSPVYFTPIFFYREYVCRAPIALRGKAPMIVERSTDPRSQLAKNCEDPSKRLEMRTFAGAQYEFRNQTQLNFVCVVNHPEHPLDKTEFIVTFAGGSIGGGERLAQLVKMRKASPFGCVFQMSVDPTPRKNEKGDWYVLKIDNPPQGVAPWVGPEAYIELNKTYDALRAAFRDQRLSVEDEEDHADAAAAAAVAATSTEAGQF
jgi:hypothetical protein